MVALFAGDRGVQVFVCSVQTSMGNFTGVIGLVMGGVMRDYLRFCFGVRTGVRGSVGVGANGCSGYRCSGEAMARVMAVVVANVWRAFPDLFWGECRFPPPSGVE